MTSTIRPRELVKVQDREFRILWEDGHRSVYPFRLLRLNCACAFCRDEITGKVLIDPAAVPTDLRGLGASPVGLYGLRFDFSDGHATGIYTFQALRALCPCELCAASPR